ncbi:MAG: ABC transporter transmembrane domain-containing protein, partial [Oscillospiraceae bacterium]
MADNKPMINLRPGGGPGRGPGHGPPGAMPTEKPKNLKATLSRILKYIGKNQRLIVAMLAVMLLATLLNVAAPTIQAQAIDAIAKLDANALLMWLVVMAVVYFFSAIFTYFQNLFAAMLSQFTVKVMRKDLFARISKLPIRYMDTHKHGDILSRMTNDVENVSNSVSQSLGSLISGVIMLIGCFVMMLVHSWLMTLVSLVTIVLTLVVTKNLSKLMRRFFPLQQAKLGQLNGQIEEAVSGCKTVKAFTHEGRICDDFNRTSDELRTVGVKAQILGGSMGPCMNTIGNFGFLLIAVVGAVLASRPETDMFYISIGTIQAFITYSKQFTRPINEIANQFAQIQSALAGAERVFEVMDSEPENAGGNEPFEIENVKGDLNFKDIDFSYIPGEQVLKNFDLWVKSG